MKNAKWWLLFWLVSINFPVQAQTPNDDFCQRFPLNSRCRDNPSENSSNSVPNNLRSRDNKIVDNLTIDKVERYLRELGYINFTRKDQNSFVFLMEGRPCFVYIGSKGNGMLLSSVYPEAEAVTLEAINDWNKSFGYSLAFIWTTPEKRKSVILQTSLTVTGGVTERRIKNFFVFHAEYQRQFAQYLNKL